MYRLAITGLSGVIGQKFLATIPNDIEVVDLYHERKSTCVGRRVRHVQLNLLATDSIATTLATIQPDAILNLAAMTHIDRCEAERHLGYKSLSWKINVDAVNALATFAQASNTYLLHLSTECVFDGLTGMYTESSDPNPRNWYGITKAKGEEAVLDVSTGAVLRSVIAFHANDFGKTLYGMIAKKLMAQESVPAITDAYFTPTPTDIILQTIHILLSKRLPGVWHIASQPELTPYEFASTIALAQGSDVSLITPVTKAQFFGSERAQLRLDHASLNCKMSCQRLGIESVSV